MPAGANFAKTLILEGFLTADSGCRHAKKALSHFSLPGDQVTFSQTETLNRTAGSQFVVWERPKNNNFQELAIGDRLAVPDRQDCSDSH